jgi:hypothetical protein
VATDAESQVAKQLDDDHDPETNGRMAVCRRCGSRTDSPTGHNHAPLEHQLHQLGEWLLGQARLAHVERVRQARGG